MDKTLVRTRKDSSQDSQRDRGSLLGSSLLGLSGFQICKICGKKPISSPLTKRKKPKRNNFPW